jgi:hypothetical protein
LRAQGDLAAARDDLGSMTALLDTVAHPLWLRDAGSALVWANQAYLKAVEARSLEDARGRSLELLDAATRAEAERRRQAGEAFEGRVGVVLAGRRRKADVVERPTARGCAGMAVDVSELESMRADLQRQMQAHVRTLNELPTAVAIFDRAQHLVSTTRPTSASGASIPHSCRASPRTARCSIACARCASCPSRRISAPGRRRRFRPIKLSNRARPGGISPTGAPCAWSSIPIRRAASPICSTT